MFSSDSDNKHVDIFWNYEVMGDVIHLLEETTTSWDLDLATC